MDAGMWKCHHDYRSADLWYRASCQWEMPSCYLHSFKTREKTAEILESKKRGRGVESFTSGDLVENQKPAEQSKLPSPMAGELFSKLPRAGGHPLLTAGLPSSSLQPSIWEDRHRDAIQHPREEYPNSEVPWASHGAWEQHRASNEEPVCRSLPGYILTASEQEGFSP